MHPLRASAITLFALATTCACSRAKVEAVPAAKASAQASASPSATTTQADAPLDPLQPDRPPTRQPERTMAADWVKARPAFQISRKAAERGGVEPCNTQPVDASAFEDWIPLQQGHYTAPRDNPLDAAGQFNLVIHFHGDQPVLRELVASKQRFVLYTLSLDPSQSYGPLIASGGLFEAVVAGIEQSLSKRTGRAAKVGKVALSAWSIGFTGVASMIARPNAGNIDSVILIDGLHAARDTQSFTAQLQPFVDYAKRAASSERFMFVSHSSILPPDFASTTECAHYLESALGGKPEPVHREDAAGLELIELFSRGDLHVRGYAGNDKPDHCAQLFLLRDAFRAVGTRWSSAAPSAH